MLRVFFFLKKTYSLEEETAARTLQKLELFVEE
jgi:hypothetical protein